MSEQSAIEWTDATWNPVTGCDRQGRMQRDYWTGKRSPNARLTVAQVVEIRARYADGNTSQARLGRQFGISKRAIGRCLHAETYADV